MLVGEQGFMLCSHTMGELSLTSICAGATHESTKMPHRSHWSWLQHFTRSRRCQNPSHNKLPLLLCCSFLLSYSQGMPFAARKGLPTSLLHQHGGFRNTAFQITYSTGSICHAVWGPCCPHGDVVAWRSPPPCSWSEHSSLPAQAIPQSPTK